MIALSHFPQMEENPNCTGLQKGSKKTSLGTPGKDLCMKPQVGTPNCRTSNDEDSIFRCKPLVLTTMIKWKQCTTHARTSSSFMSHTRTPSSFFFTTHSLIQEPRVPFDNTQSSPLQAHICQPIQWPLCLIHIQKASFFASIAFNTTRSHDQCYSILDIILNTIQSHCNQYNQHSRLQHCLNDNSTKLKRATVSSS